MGLDLCQSNRAGFNRYRSKSGGAGFSKDRSGSQPKQKSELAKDVEEIKKDMKEMKKMMDELKKAKANCVNHFVEEEYEVNVRYVDEAKGMNMIVDSGAPVSIATSEWMEKYLNNMEVKKEETTENKCKRIRGEKEGCIGKKAIALERKFFHKEKFFMKKNFS